MSSIGAKMSARGVLNSSCRKEVPVKRFADLSEQEILALAISNEEEDSRIYRGFAEGLRQQFPASAKVFDEMADEEVRHRTMLFELYRTKFGDYLPLIRRQDVKGFITHKPLWLMRPLGVDAGAAVRRGLCHAQYLGHLPGRDGRLGRRRHLHGVRRGAVGRRLAHRTRHALASWRGVRHHDGGRRTRAYAALPDPQFR